MKVLAIITAAPGAPIERIRAEIRNEVIASWELFTAGVLREAYATANPARVVFLLEADDAADAGQHLRKLPLIAAGLLDVETMELRPFANWSLLFAR